MRSQQVQVALYARVSSERQAQAGTIESQVEELRERIEEDGQNITDEMAFVDDGYSGATLVRPALERLRDMAAAGCLERVYVHSPDRLARKYAYQVLVVDELRRCGIEIIFLNHGVGESPEDSLLLQVQGMVAEYERAKILERSRRGKLHGAKMGAINVLSGAPYGYRYIAAGDGRTADYEIDLEQAKVVRWIFEWVGRDGCSMQEVCRRLHDKEIPTRTGKSWWDRSTVWGMLKNPAYKGTAAFGKTRIGPRRPALRPHRGAQEQPRRVYSTYEVPIDQWTFIPVPAIVSEELFEAVQETLEENRKRKRQTARGARYLLQGMLACAKCGYAYYGKPVSRASAKGGTRNYVYYRCVGTDAYRFGGRRVCSNKQVRSDTLEEAVWTDVCSLLSNPKRIEREYERRLAGKPDDGWDGTDKLRTVVNKLQRGISRLIDSYQEGLIEKEEFEPRMRKTRERLARAKADLRQSVDEQQQRDALYLVIGRMKEFAEKVTDGLENASWEARRAIIRAIVKRIEIDENDVRVVYKIQPNIGGEDTDNDGFQHCWKRKHPALRAARLRTR